MTEPLSISNELPEQPGMNFALLRQEGIKHIERLGGKIWTDYNTHDPGITILEQLCYAITDLSYRLDFPLKDLLAPYPGEERKQFFTAREILTVNPLTINDYRKLLIDIYGVKNAWLEPITDPYPEIYYNRDRHILSFTSSESSERVNLNGLYRVQIEKQTASIENDLLIRTVKSKLNQHRNLCEDFAQIEVLPIEEITVKAEIEIQEGKNVNDLMAKIYFALDQFIAPDLQFFTLKELLLKGKSPEEIFNGVFLEHGFIDDDELESFTRKEELRTSDLIQIILDIDGIKAIKTITISGNKSSDESWVLPLDSNSTAKIQDIERAVKKITFTKNQITYNPDLEKVKAKLAKLDREKSKKQTTEESQDIPIPTGKYRELSEYESIQNDFPANYGIGELGLAASTSTQRKGQAKQLQAYLMFFDRILANYFAQLDGVKDLFSFDTQNNTTYFIQELINFPGFKEIFERDYHQLLEDKAVQLERKNRFLDHLMAQYCEKFTDYSLLLYESILEDKEKSDREEIVREEHINNKITFLQNYPQISSRRSKAFNYNDSNIAINLENISGLKQRICSLLGIPYTRQALASSEQTEGFYIVEHILLRPQAKNISKESANNFLDFSHPISEFKSSADANKVTCKSLGHELIEGDLIQIFGTRNYNGTFLVSNIRDSYFNNVPIKFWLLLLEIDCLASILFLRKFYKHKTFDIEKEFISLKEGASETGQWIEADRPLDPYSFQLSFVFPNWLPRFKDSNFKQLLFNTITSELPAHLTPYYHWLELDKMREFETAYSHWLNTVATTKPNLEELQSSINTLIKILQIGQADIIPFKVIGYMTIGDDFIVS